MQAPKYYVVWKGYAPGVYDSWEEAEMQVSGYPDAQYRAFKSMEAAVEAFREGFDRQGLIAEVNAEMKRLGEEGTKIEYDPAKKPATPSRKSGTAAAPATSQSSAASPVTVPSSARPAFSQPVAAPSATSPKPYILESIAVDAACSGNPGPMEYRGVYVKTGQVLFKVGPMAGGTNNIGEFLAIVHALALQEKQGTHLPVYSDSVNAQGWVRQGICKTTLQENATTTPIFDLIRRAETWLRTHRITVPIIKWDTKAWGEIPADFGRK